MKRIAALILCLCLLYSSCAFAQQEYTVAEKLVKQLWAGSGFSGVLTAEMAALDGQTGLETLKPIVIDVDYIYVRPTEEETDEHRIDLRLMDGETQKSTASIQYKEEALSLRSDLTGDSWYVLDASKAQQGAALSGAISGVSARTGAPALTKAAGMILTALTASTDAEEWTQPYTTRLDIWMEGYRQDAVLGKTEDGTTTMQVNYLIPPAAIRAQVKQLVYDLMNDSAARNALTDALGEETAQLYLNPALQDWYFRAIDALPLTGDLTVSRTVSLKGDALDLQIALPLYDAETGDVLLSYARTQGGGDLPEDHVITLETAERLLTLTYQEYSSMTGVKVLQGVLESTGADFSVSEDAQDFGVSFTLKQEESTSKDLEDRDVYAYAMSLSLAPVEGSEALVEETEIEFTSRFVSKELKSAATAVEATLTVTDESTVSQFTFEGTSRKKWEPEEITGTRTSVPDLTEAELAQLGAEAGLKALALFSEYAVLPEE